MLVIGLTSFWYQFIHFRLTYSSIHHFFLCRFTTLLIHNYLSFTTGLKLTSFTNPSPRSFTSSFRTAFLRRLSPGLFFLSYSVFVFSSNLLSPHADSLGVDISVAFCLFVLFCLLVILYVQLRISPVRIKLAASNFARWFIGVPGRQSLILGNFALPEAQNRTNRPPTRK